MELIHAKSIFRTFAIACDRDDVTCINKNTHYSHCYAMKDSLSCGIREKNTFIGRDEKKGIQLTAPGRPLSC